MLFLLCTLSSVLLVLLLDVKKTIQVTCMENVCKQCQKSLLYTVLVIYYF